MSSFEWPPSGGGTGVTTIDGISGAVTLVAGTGISITDNSPSPGSITIASTSSGDVTIGAFGSTPNANGLSISGSQVLNMQPADATHPGGISIADWNTFNNKQSALTIGNITDVGTDGIVITGGTGAIIGSGVSLAQHVADSTHNGYLSSTDWSTFNSKQSALTLTNLTDAGTDGIVITNGTGAVIGASPVTIAQQVADATHNGYLSSANWSTFNGKQAAGNYITALTGDVAASGPGSAAATLATVNGNVGSFGSATQVATFTVNAKGLTTAAGNTAIAIPFSQVSGTVPLNQGGTGQTTKAAAFDALSPMTTGGQIIYGGASGTGTALANGSVGNILKSAGGTSAPAWATNVTMTQGFDAYRTTSQTVTAGTPLEVVPNTSVFNVGSGYSTSTGRFTAGVTGYYQFQANTSIAIGATPPGIIFTYFQVNGTGQQLGSWNWSGVLATLTYSAVNAKIIFLNSGDYVSVWANSTTQNVTVTGTGGTGENTSFSGFLVGV